MVLCVVIRAGRIPFDELVRACVPFYFAVGAAPARIVAFPSLVAFLPSMVLGR